MKKSSWLLFLVFLFSCGGSQEGIQPEKSSITESVYASGQVRARDEYKVYSTVSGIIQDILLKEGDSVSAGTRLLVIRNENVDLNASNARIAYDLAKENFSGRNSALDELELQVNTARVKMEQDSLQFDRFKKLRESNAVAQVDYENVKLAYELSKNNFKAAEKRLLSTKKQLKAEMDRAQNAFRMSSNTSGDYVIQSRLKGTLYALYKNPGELVLPQEPLALLGSSHQFYAELLIDELDISKVKLGQKVWITLDTYGDKTFEASLTRIYPMPDARTQTFKVEAEFTNPPTPLYPGLTLEGNIVVGEKKEALLIPSEYVLEGDSIELISGQRKPITVGLRNMEKAEVLSGLSENEMIRKPVLEE